MRASAGGGKFFSWYNQKMRKRDYFKCIEIRFENEDLELRKNVKLSYEISILGIKWKPQFLSK